MGAAHPRIGPPRTIGEAESLIAQLELPYPGRDRFIDLGNVEGESLKNAICCLANGDKRAPQARAYLVAMLTISSKESLVALAQLGYPGVSTTTLSRCIKEGDVNLPALVRRASSGDLDATHRVREIFSFVGNLDPAPAPASSKEDAPCQQQETTIQKTAPDIKEPPLLAPRAPLSSPSLIRCEDERGQHGLSLIGSVMEASSLPRALAVCMGWQKEAVCGQLTLRHVDYGVKAIHSNSDVGFYEGENLFEFSDAILRAVIENRPHLSAESVLTMAKALFSVNGVH